MNEDKNKPVTIRDKDLKSTIWKNENQKNKSTYYTVTLAKTIKDNDGNYRDIQSYSQNDMLRLAELARESYGKVNELKREEFKALRANESAHEREQSRQR